MRTRGLILMIAISTVGFACSPDDPETSTTASGSTTSTVRDTSTTTSPSSTTTGGGIDVDAYPIPAGTFCFYLAGYVAVPFNDVDDASSALGDVEPVPASEVLAATSHPDEAPPTDEEIAAIDSTMVEAVGFFEVTDDPLQVSLLLRDQKIQASPIHLIGFNSHYHYQPGTDPSPVSGLELPDVSTDLNGQRVAVVDSGIVPPADLEQLNPAWFYGTPNQPFVLYDSMDEEAPDPASHGTFVSGLIRQLAPSHLVTFASARLVDPARIIEQGEDFPPGVTPTAEIQVAEAITRLMLRHPDESAETMKALNLSLGTYLCDPTNDADLVTLNASTSQWLAKYEGTQIMAAAGNDNHRGPVIGIPGDEYVPFYPAALPDIRAVAAVDRAGNEIVWINKSPEVVEIPPGRPWVTDWAPGADLVNLAGGVTSGGIPALVCWSGSSFATAVASAQVALGTNPSPNYDSAQRLTFVESSAAAGSEVVTVGGSSSPAPECDHDSEG